MIFLIHYDPPAGRILTYKKYDASERLKAREERLAIELDLFRQGIDHHEVVLLEAENEKNIRITHQRYFETPAEILESMRDDLQKRTSKPLNASKKIG